MNVLVTGATGFIGREIVSEFIKNKHRVTALGNSKKINDRQNPEVCFFYADITDYKNLSDLEKLPELDVIIHSAGLAHQFGETKREEFEAVNIKGTENILRLALKLRIKHFILIGSTAVYGNVSNNNDSKENPAIIDENTATNPKTLYAESKLESEKVCRRICEASQMALTIFRLAPVIGEANAGNVERLIKAIDNNRFVWIGSGTNLKTLIYKQDVARACVRLAEKKQNATETFNLAAEPVKMKDFVNEIAIRLDKKLFPISMPAALLRLVFRVNSEIFKLNKINKISETVEKWLSDDVYSSDKIAKTYGFKTQTPIFEALARQIDYYKSNEKQ